MHVTTSPSDCFSHVSHLTSLDEVRQPVMKEADVNSAASQRSVAEDHALRLLILPFFCYLHALLGSNTLYTLEDDKLL